jgi:regulator of sigma E protease
LVPWQPELEPVVDRVEPGSRAEQAGLLPGDRIISADGAPVKTWQDWVKIVRGHPEVAIRLVVDRGAAGQVPVTITPARVEASGGPTGRIGASARIPPDIEQQMQVTYRLDFFPALLAATAKTADYSLLTLKMIGRMLVGKAALENLSGPLSIAQYAGASARLGLAQFLKFLAAISVSLGVLNLLPIPVLDGGHLTLYGIEWIMGRPLSEQTVMICQQVGMFILISLMSLAFYLDLERLLS